MNKQFFKELLLLLKLYWQSNKKKQAWVYLSVALVLMILLSANNTFMTYVTKWAMNALERKDVSEFKSILWLAASMFIIAVPVNALQNYSLSNLAYYWRKWLNDFLLDNYFKNKTYYKIYLYSDIDNPDQRIAQDASDFVLQSTMFLDLFGMSIIALFTFLGVLWSISFWLVLSVLAYAFVGTFITILITRQLIKVNFKNIQYQADYRYNIN